MFGRRLLAVAALSLAGLVAVAGCAISVQRTQQPNPTQEPTATATATPMQVVPPVIRVLSPQEGQVVSAGAVRVKVSAPDDATVAVNGVVAEAKVDGTFSVDVLLEEGANLIDISATDVSGGVTYEDIVVFVFDQGEVVTLDVTGPADGYVTDEAFVALTGSTVADASVAVNGVPVTVNQFGIFETAVALEPGPNLIELVAVGSDGGITVKNITVFSER